MGFAGIGIAFVLTGLIAGFIPPPNAEAESNRIVSVYFDGQKRVVTTDSSTVQEVLNEVGADLSEGDIVEPAANTAIPAGFFNINVYRSRPVVVVDGSSRRMIRTASKSPRLIAEAAGIKTYPEDRYVVSTIHDLADFGTIGQEVAIDRATPVIINSDGKSITVRTHQKQVEGLLKELDVALGPQDTTQPAGETPISENLIVAINRVKVVTVDEPTTIPRQVQNVKDPSLEIGNTVVKDEGADGTKVSTFRIHYQNGVETARELLASKVTVEPKPKVVTVGTKIDYSASPVELGKQMAAQVGWTDDQWEALYKLWSRESGWNPQAMNYSSGACGIPQALPCSKITDKSVAGQIRWGLNYIAERYGTPAKAWAFWVANGSY